LQWHSSKGHPTVVCDDDIVDDAIERDGLRVEGLRLDCIAIRDSLRSLCLQKEHQMRQLITAVILLTLCPSALAVTISPGDVYQQPSTVFLEAIDLDLQGGTIIDRADGAWTWFLSGDVNISSGVVDTRLRLDNSPTDVVISGGVFNNEVQIDRNSATISGGVFNGALDIDRVLEHGTLTITGGTFNGSVFIQRYQGDVSIEGGDFKSGVTLIPSFTGGALPTLTFVGTEWQFSGQPLTFNDGEADITGNETGTLTGKLADGNPFSVWLISSQQSARTIVRLIPEPSTAILSLLLVIGLSTMVRRQKYGATVQRGCMMMIFMGAPFLLTQNCQASIVVTATETGEDVVFTGSGTLDLSALSWTGNGFSTGSNIQANPSEFALGTTETREVQFYEGSSIARPASLGVLSSLAFADSGSGDRFGPAAGFFAPHDPFLIVPVDYISGGSLSGSMTFSGATLASLGINPGTYVWSWGAGSNADSFTLQAVPEPSTTLFAGLAVAVFGMRRTRFKPVH